MTTCRPRYRTRYLSTRHPLAAQLDDCPSAGPHPNIAGMKNLYWGLDALCVRSGAYVYKVNHAPQLYAAAH